MTYEYECRAGVTFEVEAKISDPILIECPVCNNCKPKRLISAPSKFFLKEGEAGGWSSTGYALSESKRRYQKITGKKRPI